jgi:hypothetical protein
MVPKRAGLVLGLLCGLVLGGAQGCATSATVGDDDDDSSVADGGKPDRAEQVDAPPFNEDAGAQDDANPGDGPAPDGPVQQDAAGGDGGTCSPEADEAVGGDTCVDAIDKGSLTDLTSSHLVISGNLWPAGDVDWYKVTFVDTADDAQACDKFNARIAFTATGNPGGRYAFDVLLGDCATAPTCGTAGDSNLATTDFKWDDSGECPCNADPVNTIPNVKVCVDHSMVLKLRVFRVSGSPICETYELALDNGPP